MSAKRLFFTSLICFLGVLTITLIEAFFNTKMSLSYYMLKLFEISLLVVLIRTVFSAGKYNNEECRLSGLWVFIFSLLSAYKILYFCANNIERIPPSCVFCFTFVCIAVFYVLYFLFRNFFKNDCKALILALSVMLFCFIDINPPVLLHFYCGAVSFLVTVIYLYGINKIVAFLKPFAATLIAICFLNGAVNLIKTRSTALFKKTSHIETDFKANKIPNRDVYIILLDMYAGRRGLQSLGYDNSDFIDVLQNKGFVVWDNIESNYSKTIYTIPSFLNADYVENISDKTPQEAVNDAKMFKLARNAGYRVYYINSWPIGFHIDEGVIDEAYNSTSSISTSILKLFMGKTVFGPLFENYNINDNEDRLQAMFSCADSIIKRDNNTKRFVFIHFLMPHDPYIYDENGNLNPPNLRENTEEDQNATLLNSKAYLGFLKYANRKTIEYIDRILTKHQKQKPIIIVMGDHGIRPFFPLADLRKYDKRVEENYKYYFNTIFAYYNPDYDAKYFKSTNSLINFSINFMNENFDTGIKNVKDRYFYVAPQSAIPLDMTKTVEVYKF